MAQYSNFKKPAFYIPIGDYMQSLGNVEWSNDAWNDIHLLNPTKTHRISLPPESQFNKNIRFKDSIPYNTIADADGYIYIFILGHNLYSEGSHLEVGLQNDEDDQDSYIVPSEIENIINYQGLVHSSPEYNGFSIIKAKVSVSNVYGITIIIRNLSSYTQNRDIKIGCVSLCSKWNPPHTPDLSLTMTREYDGVKNTTTKGGATLSDASYTRGGTFWATNYAWELGTNDYNQGQSFNAESSRTMGRRIWSMKFSYLSPENVMPKTESLNHYNTSLDLSDSNLYSQSFFSRVLNRIQGSHLPFIFQANDTDPNTNPDQWAIVRFDQGNFSITQAAPDLYSLSMKLRESY